MGEGAKPDSGWWQDEKGKWRQPTALERRSRIALVGGLILHGFGALTWLAFMGFAADAGSTREFFTAVGIGGALWLVAALLMVWLWRARREVLVWLVPFAWWYPSWLFAAAVAYGI